MPASNGCRTEPFQLPRVVPARRKKNLRAANGSILAASMRNAWNPLRSATSMANEEALELMRSAWATRRASFDAAPAEKRALMTRAKKDLATAVEMCREGGSPVSHAQAVHLLANVELDMGHEDRARSLWEQAVSILRETDAVLQLAHKVRHLGDLHRHCGRLGDAESCYSEALALYREHDGPGSLDFANAVSRMADLKERRGDSVQALSLWRETRDLYAAVDLAPGVAEAERHMERLTP